MRLTREELLLEQWKLASELHRHMDNIVWQQLNFFAGFNVALFPILGLTVSWLGDTPLLGAIATFLLCSIGAYISVLWRKVQARQKAYQAYRIAQAAQAERMLLVKGQQYLSLYQQGVNEQKLVPVPTEARQQILSQVHGFAKATFWLWTLLAALAFAYLTLPLFLLI